MHKGSYPGHTYFVIDKDGIIRYARDDSTMGIRNNEIAAELEKIKGV
jgi:peroxiredoxin